MSPSEAAGSPQLDLTGMFPFPVPVPGPRRIPIIPSTRGTRAPRSSH